MNDEAVYRTARATPGLLKKMGGGRSSQCITLDEVYKREGGGSEILQYYNDIIMS